MCLCHVGYNPRISLKGMREDVLEKRNKKSGALTFWHRNFTFKF